MRNPFRKEHPIKPSAKEENILPECPHSFGYLAIRAKNDPIAQECLFCQKLADCMVITVHT